MTRYGLIDDEKALRDRAAEIGVEVSELEVAESAARTFTAGLHDLEPLSYDMLEDAYLAATIANHGVEPKQLIVSSRMFAEIKGRVFFGAQQRLVPQPPSTYGLRFNSAVIVSGDIADSEIGWRGINGRGVLHPR